MHGSAYEFHRNDDLDASNFFSNKNNVSKPFRLRNQFGATIGGPIVKNKTFFFTDYEGLRDRLGTVRTSSVPQPNWRRGMFTIPDLQSIQRDGHRVRTFASPPRQTATTARATAGLFLANLIDPVGKTHRRCQSRSQHGCAWPDRQQLRSAFRSRATAPISSTSASITTFRANFNLFGRYSFSDTNLFQPCVPALAFRRVRVNDTFGSALWRSQAVAAGAHMGSLVDAGFGNALRVCARELLPDTAELRLWVPGTAHWLEGSADGREHLRRHSSHESCRRDRTSAHRSDDVGAAVSDSALLQLPRLFCLDSRQSCNQVRG